MIDIDSLFESFDTSEKKVTYNNKEDIMFFLNFNVAQLVYAENGKTHMVVITANRELVRIFKEKTGPIVKQISKTITKRITKGKQKNITSLEIKAFDFIKEKPFSIPLKCRWKIIRYVPITEKNIEELNDRMRGVFVANKMEKAKTNKLNDNGKKK